jgi:hypothetical protein
MSKETIGMKLQALRERSGLSLGNIARSGGFRGPSSIQRYFSPDYDPEFLPQGIAKRLKDALIGFGSPAINQTDIEALTEYGFMMQRQPPPRIDVRRARRAYIECSTAFPIGDRDGMSLLALSTDPARFFAAPEHLWFRSVDAFFMEGVSMAPRYKPGEVIFFERERPVALGQDAVFSLSLHPDDSDASMEEVIVGTLVERTPDDITVRILNPDISYVIPLSEIDALCPILQPIDLLEQISQKKAYAPI